MSDTPRVDAIAHHGLPADQFIARMTDLARQLERELETTKAVLNERLIERQQTLMSLSVALHKARKLIADLAGEERPHGGVSDRNEDGCECPQCEAWDKANKQ